jgi:hypothetical protein
MSAFYKSAFRKFVKKQSRPFQLAIEDETERIFKDPGAGETKRGDLAGFKVHKFTFHKQQYLIAYRMQGKDIFFYMIDTHENFYRELKRYIKGG